MKILHTEVYHNWVPASRRACMGALLTAGTAVLEPTLAIEVRVPTDLVGNVATVLSGKRGKVLDMSAKRRIKYCYW